MESPTKRAELEENECEKSLSKTMCNAHHKGLPSNSYNDYKSHFTFKLKHNPVY